MSFMSEFADRILPKLVLGLLFGGLVFFTVKRSEDPARLLFKWILSAFLVVLVVWKVLPMADSGGMAAFAALADCMLVGVVLAVTWRHDIGALIAKPFSSLYDGGNVEPEPQPFYSIARARQKQGKYLDAAEEVRKQLERFPMDVEGQMFLAEIQAQDLKDLAAAEATLQTFCGQPGHAPKNIAFALYSLADWQLKIGQDVDAARRALQQIIDLLPDSEFALTASQRIGHLTDSDALLGVNADRKYLVKEGVRNLGLIQDTRQFQPKEVDPAMQAAELVRHLEEHPLDTEVRERLALIYANHYHRLDLATDQLEQMIQLENQPPKQVVRWLNILADLQIREGMDYDTVKQTLQRIIDIAPELAAAETARKRLGLLKLELKAKTQNQSVKMGTYEQNLGLKPRSPR
jgi:tetratricopeptide (TPR) repeat protein